MNSFFVPQLGSQIYTMAGMTSQLSLEADRAASYPGLSAQFSGRGFADMHFEVLAVPAAAYAAWIASAKAAQHALDNAAYARLVQPIENAPPTIYGNVTPGLFDAIVGGTAPSDPAGQHQSTRRKGT
jgi:cytochrome o ubiquinol oxidase subunit 2